MKRRIIFTFMLLGYVMCLCSCGKNDDIKGNWNITWYDGETWKDVIISDDAILCNGAHGNVEEITGDEVFWEDFNGVDSVWKYSINDDELQITWEGKNGVVKGIGYRTN